jgi:hypothetical protein
MSEDITLRRLGYFGAAAKNSCYVGEIGFFKAYQK